MAKTPIKVGSVVKLKGGGLDMTVSSIKPFGIACVWLDAKGRRQESTFNEELLISSGVSQETPPQIPEGRVIRNRL